MIIEIERIKDNSFVMVSEELSLSFDGEGNLSITDQYSGEFSELNYNKNIKHLTFTELIENSSASFEKFSLVSKTELLRRSLNFLCYIVIFLVGLEILLSFVFLVFLLTFFLTASISLKGILTEKDEIYLDTVEVFTFKSFEESLGECCNLFTQCLVITVAS